MAVVASLSNAALDPQVASQVVANTAANGIRPTADGRRLASALTIGAAQRRVFGAPIGS